MQDVQIDIFITAHIDEYGLTCIILFNEVLWFGTSMDHLLVNPNQIQMTVMPVSDDPFDENWKLGIDHKKVFIPFYTDGTTLYFYSRVPN